MSFEIEGASRFVKSVKNHFLRSFNRYNTLLPEPGVDYGGGVRLAVVVDQRFRLFGGNHHSTTDLLGMGDDLINCLLQVIPFRYVVLDKLDVGHFRFVFIKRTGFD